MTFSAPSAIFLTLFVVLSVINCTKIKYMARGKVELFTKPFIALSLLGFYLFALKANVPAPQSQWEIKAALIFYAVGDACLIFSNKIKAFAAGVGAFLVGHIFYGFFFIKLKLPHHSLLWALAAAAVFVPFLVLLKRKLSKTDEPKVDLMMAYGFFMMFLIASVASTFTGGRPLGTVLALVGGVLYAISDSMIGIRMTGQKILPGESIMITYTSALLLLCFGVLLLQM